MEKKIQLALKKAESTIDRREALLSLTNLWMECRSEYLFFSISYDLLETIYKLTFDLEDYSDCLKWILLSKEFLSIRKEIDVGVEDFRLGSVYFELGQFEKAKLHFSYSYKKSHGICFDNSPVKYESFYFDKDCGYDAVDFDYDALVKLTEIGEELFSLEEYEKAIFIYRKALRLIPSPKKDWEASFWVYIAIADSYFFLNDYHKVLHYATLADITCDEDNPFILLRIGQSLYELGVLVKANNYLMKAYLLDGLSVFDYEKGKGEDSKYLKFIGVI